MTSDVVTFELNVDVPTPRCAKVISVQRLRVVNRTSEPIRVQLAHFDLTLAPGAAEILDAPVGNYLAPGVHGVRTSLYGGSGPEVRVIGS